MRSILGTNFSIFEYQSYIKYSVINLKHFRVEQVEQDLP